jgi:hypothetical protein
MDEKETKQSKNLIVRELRRRLEELKDDKFILSVLLQKGGDDDDENA